MRASSAGQFYNFPCFPSTVPDLQKEIANDPRANPPDKYKVLGNVLDWATNVGYPGYATAGIAEAFNDLGHPDDVREGRPGRRVRRGRRQGGGRPSTSASSRDGNNAGPMAVVETRNLTKVFKEGELGAVNDVSLATNEGEFLVFLGPSGSGKTTLLRMIAGLETPDVRRDPHRRPGGERPVAARAPHRHGLPELRALSPPHGLQEHRVSAEGAEGPEGPAREEGEWAAGLLGIGRLLDRKPRELSGGERQRVALARAIVREPAVFLLDEPLSNLDAKLRASAREELEQFQDRVGTTTIYVTHDQVEAMAMGDRIVVMNKGRVRQIGTPGRGLRRAGRHVRRHLPGLAPDEPRRGGGRDRGLPAGALLPGPRRSPSRDSVPMRGPRPRSGQPRGVPRRRAHPLRDACGRSPDGTKVVSRIASSHAGVFAKDTTYDFAVAEAPPEALRPGDGKTRKRPERGVGERRRASGGCAPARMFAAGRALHRRARRRAARPRGPLRLQRRAHREHGLPSSSASRTSGASCRAPASTRRSGTPSCSRCARRSS